MKKGEAKGQKFRTLAVRLSIGCAAVVALGGVYLAPRVDREVSATKPALSREDLRVARDHYATATVGKKVALTFDDGPHPEHTPVILDALDRYRAPATFFVIGENVLEHPLVARDIVSRGYAIGNHSFTHAEEVHVTPERIRGEILNTERVIWAVLGVETEYYRAPFLLDMGGSVLPDPDAPLRPAIRTILDLGYVPLGVDRDSYDWATLISEEMSDYLVTESVRGSVVLLHDNAETAEELPRLIEELREGGYEIVPLSTLVPPPTRQAATLAAATTAYSISDILTVWSKIIGIHVVLTLSYLAIALFIVRIVALVFFFVFDALRTEYKREPYTGLVSVIIPAYNEMDNIEATMLSVIHNTSVRKEIIVVDDGSTDKTFEIATRVAEEHKNLKIRVIYTPNGGKARALNIGVSHARGIVVVCMDGDTIFTPTTLAHLIEPFADPRVGAVSGKVYPCTATNIMERMQSIEYLIGQNVIKRAFSTINGISVIPGAVGAFRKRDVIAVGGFSTDTMVEDQDITLALLARGRKVVYARHALAYTEVPRTVHGFLRQRFRWMFGTFQCLFKYRRALIHPKTPAGLRVALVNTTLFDLFLPAFYPVADAVIVYAIISGSFPLIALPILLFTLLDLFLGVLAALPEKDRRYALIHVLLMRVVYRPLMYLTFARCILRLLEGRAVLWQSVARRGDAQRMFIQGLRPFSTPPLGS
jgi:cellulose synthase/poly-beta-1,6-N-acetylglucosamine synthase-like glycosyltransferase/peptidoglycan/xylan/chitin deacetylase (PgdA/CDA1 family)